MTQQVFLFGMFWEYDKFQLVRYCIKMTCLY